MASVSQVTCSDPDPAARDVHHRSSAALQSAVWSLSGKFPSACFRLLPLSLLEVSDGRLDSTAYSGLYVALHNQHQGARDLSTSSSFVP